jgi:predicted O-methyltransferase YrrM
MSTRQPPLRFQMPDASPVPAVQIRSKPHRPPALRITVPDPPKPTPPKLGPFQVRGMHGLGDCLHQRALIRHYLALGDVYLSTPWPCVYHDLQAQGLKLVKPYSALYTQAKNERREVDAYDLPAFPTDHKATIVRPGYTGAGVLRYGSIVDDMCQGLPTTDFSLLVPQAWKDQAQALLEIHGITQPFALVRPLTQRNEYEYLLERNPDEATYEAICHLVRERYPLVSVADLADPKREWPVHLPAVDVAFYDGVMATTLIGLAALATVIVTPPGMMAPLAQAVGTPHIVVFGSYENAQSFAAGYRMAPYCPIEPITPARYIGDVGTSKKIAYGAAVLKIERFLSSQLNHIWAPRRTVVQPHPAPLDWTGIPDAARSRFMSELELGVLARLLQGRRKVMEIGCQNGRTARAMLNSVPGIERYIGVDLERGVVPSHSAQRGEAPVVAGEFALGDKRFHLVLKPRGSLDVPLEDIHGYLDAVFIDGDHSRQGVERDTYLAIQSLKPGGIVVWHDDFEPSPVDVSAVLDNFVKTQRWRVYRVAGTWLSYMEAT